ncbi:UNVERIFIED_ORG: hypothetical protein J2W19_003063 [Shinella zoogloeoides]|nr:hypothetical protein [Shinella zoogloeoides]
MESITYLYVTAAVTYLYVTAAAQSFRTWNAFSEGQSFGSALDRCTDPLEHEKTAINGLAPSGGFLKDCSIMMNDLEIFVKPPLTAE